MQPYGLINNGLINHGLVGNGIIGPGLLNEIDDGLVIPFRSDALMYGCTVEDGQLIDNLGRSEFPSVIPAQAVGDGTWYGEVHYNDGTAFTDDDLPTNYVKRTKIKIGDFSGFYGLWGVDASGADNLYCRTQNTVGDFAVAISGILILATTPLVAGDEAVVEVVVDGNTFELKVNGVSYGSQSYMRPSTGKQLQLATQGENSLPSQHTTISDEIINTDTNEVIMHFGPEEFSQVTDTTSAAQSRIQDATGNFYMQAILAPDDYIQQDINAGEGVNATGYTVAVRNEVDNYDFSDGISGWVVSPNSSFDGSRVVFNSSSDNYYFQSNRQIVGKTYFSAVFVGDYQNGEVYPDGQSALAIAPQNGWNYWKYTAQTTACIIDDLASAYPSQMKFSSNILFDLEAIDEALGTSYATMTAEEINAIKYDILALQKYKDSALTVLWETGQIIPAKLNADGTRSKTECIAWVEEAIDPLVMMPTLVMTPTLEMI